MPPLEYSYILLTLKTIMLASNYQTLVLFVFYLLLRSHLSRLFFFFTCAFQWSIQRSLLQTKQRDAQPELFKRSVSYIFSALTTFVHMQPTSGSPVSNLASNGSHIFGLIESNRSFQSWDLPALKRLRRRSHPSSHNSKTQNTRHVHEPVT